jgi:hypothetical protein
VGELLNAYEATVKASDATDADAALVESGRVIARRVDEAIATGTGQDVTKALYLLPHLNNVLKEMFATPASRKAAGIGPRMASVTKLGALRDVTAGRSA